MTRNGVRLVDGEIEGFTGGRAAERAATGDFVDVDVREVLFFRTVAPDPPETRAKARVAVARPSATIAPQENRRFRLRSTLGVGTTHLTAGSFTTVGHGQRLYDEGRNWASKGRDEDASPAKSSLDRPDTVRSVLFDLCFSDIALATGTQLTVDPDLPGQRSSRLPGDR